MIRRIYRRYIRIIGKYTLILTLSFLSAQMSTATELDDCMLQTMHNAEETMTIGELRLQCQKRIKDGSFVYNEKDDELPLVEKRIRQDKEHILQPFTLMAHKPTYVLLGSYNTNSYDPTPCRKQFNDPNIEFDDMETKFQLSVKFPLLVNLADNTFDIYAAYTNRSFWQVYNNTLSSPFRETNHEPEIWLQFHPKWKIFGFTNIWNSFGVSHQSNGRGGVLSRSWNRIYGWFTFERGHLAMSFKPWYRLPANGNDDNPDITEYLGHYELSASYKYGKHVFSIMSRNNIESNFHRGTIELSWSFPLYHWPYLRGYVQYFNGYGESLIDYNHRSNSLGIGFSLTDWL